MQEHQELNEICDDKMSNVNAIFPGSSPWVTSVGGTFIVNNNSVHNNRTAPICKKYNCTEGNKELPSNYQDIGWTGGGFSIYNKSKQNGNQALLKIILIPVYHLEIYLTNMDEDIQDVSAVSHNCAIYTGIVEGIDGTSCSSPIFAGIIALLKQSLKLSKINLKLDMLIKFLNLMAKDNPNIYNDIKKGNNYRTEGGCCPIKKNGGSNFGYLSTNGWDPVNGLGTPNVGLMIEWLDKNIN